MSAVDAPGWTGDWLVGWLAALGAVTIVDGMTLSWSSDAVPHAVLHGPASLDEAAALVASALPTPEDIAQLAIARTHSKAKRELTRNVDAESFSERAAIARSTHDGSLEATVTDSIEPGAKEYYHGPFDPPAPKGITIHERLMALRTELTTALDAEVAQSMAGCPRRVARNGLGFDPRRFGAGVHQDAGVWVDPVAELLAFMALRWFPVRKARRPRQRGWTGGALAERAFTWPVWTRAMDCWAVDALLDIYYGSHTDGAGSRRHRQWSVSGVWAAIPRQPQASLDSTRALASERLW